MKKITFFAGCSFLFLTVFTTHSQIISTVAGTGVQGNSGDGGPASSAELSNPNCVGVDAAGNYYIGDETANVIRMVDISSGIISTVAGNGNAAYAGDGGSATSASLNWPIGVVIDASGNIYIGDFVNQVVRKVTKTSGIITTVAGNNSLGAGFGGDGGPATSAQLNSPRYITLDKNDNLFIGDASNCRIRRVDATSGIITTVAGNGTAGFSGDGGLAGVAELNYPYGVDVDDSDNIFIADQANNRIREVRALTGLITTIAGNGVAGHAGDGGPATSAEINGPDALTVASNGDVFISGTYEQAIRKVKRATGIISTFAGDATPGFSGDGGPATSAELHYPAGITIDPFGNLYVPDWDNYRVRKITLAEEEGIKTIPNTGKGIAVYPNPAKDELFISFNGLSGKVEVTLYNILGQQILIQPYYIKQSTLSMNISSLLRGIYILKVQTEEGTNYVQKVEIER